jgi:threonine dehydrogenase-like Zn-dependent dehydrogenase
MLMHMENRSDIHFWKAGRIGPLIVESDCILGHEAAGIVLKVGEGVDELVVGESYTFSFCPFSSRCFYLFLISLSPLTNEGFGWKNCYTCARKVFAREERERARKAGGYGMHAKSSLPERDRKERQGRQSRND